MDIDLNRLKKATEDYNTAEQQYFIRRAQEMTTKTLKLESDLLKLEHKITYTFDEPLKELAFAKTAIDSFLIDCDTMDSDFQFQIESMLMQSIHLSEDYKKGCIREVKIQTNPISDQKIIDYTSPRIFNPEDLETFYLAVIKKYEEDIYIELFTVPTSKESEISVSLFRSTEKENYFIPSKDREQEKELLEIFINDFPDYHHKMTGKFSSIIDLIEQETDKLNNFYKTEEDRDI